MLVYGLRLDGGTATSGVVNRPAARCRTPGGIGPAPAGPAATRSPPDSTAAPTAQFRT